MLTKGPGMTLHELLQSVGVDPSVLFAGAGGGVLRALSRRNLKVREMVVSPICGALAAAYLTLPAVHFGKATGIPLPGEEIQAILAAAFLIGTVAMWITDWTGELIAKRLRKEPED